jgi:hypothetical protein
MAAFPDIVNGWALSPENMGMLADAFRERLLAVAGIYTSLAGGERYEAATRAAYYARPMMALIQGTPEERCCWRQMQEDLEWMALLYVNPSGESTAEKYAVRFANLAEWRAAAGLPGGGFRRGEAGTDYGLIQDRDPLRGWIVQDIVKGLKTLKWLYVLCSSKDGQTRNLGLTSVSGTPTFDELVTAANDGWAASSWTVDADAFWRRTGFTLRFLSGSNAYGFECNRCRAGLQFRYYDPIEEETIQVDAPGDFEALYCVRPNPETYFFDLAGLTQNKWAVLETVEGNKGDAANWTENRTLLDADESTPFSRTGHTAANSATFFGRTFASTSERVDALVKFAFSRE